MLRIFSKRWFAFPEPAPGPGPPFDLNVQTFHLEGPYRGTPNGILRSTIFRKGKQRKGGSKIVAGAGEGHYVFERSPRFSRVFSILTLYSAATGIQPHQLSRYQQEPSLVHFPPPYLSLPALQHTSPALFCSIVSPIGHGINDEGPRKGDISQRFNPHEKLKRIPAKANMNP